MFKIFWGGTSAKGADHGRFLNIRQVTGAPHQSRWTIPELSRSGRSFRTGFLVQNSPPHSSLSTSARTLSCRLFPAPFPRAHCLRWLVLLLLVNISGAGCRILSVHIPPANLTEPGWTVHQGQAVWHIPQGKREIAGEVLVASRPDGQAFVQFSKSPFTIATVQSAPEGWSIEFPPQHRHYSGRGAPPKRIIWLYLPRALQGQPLPKDWAWSQDSSGWRLENHSNGEILEGYFDQ